ncbi:MAG TPA: hypothetical protein VD906_09480 [Caulobacteraceae bacterium]|nr:hypothetical protein [Caulobacteraceae bacterium]
MQHSGLRRRLPIQRATGAVLSTFLLAIFNPNAAPAQPLPEPDFIQLQGVCDDVSVKNSRAVVEKVYRAARLQPGDTVEVARRKIQNLWAQGHRKQLRCDAVDFEVGNGSILKYSVRTREFNLLFAAIEKWHVPLNYVDEYDGGTILDYIEKLQEEYRDDRQLLETLTSYGKLIRQHGGRRASELTASDHPGGLVPDARKLDGLCVDLLRNDSASAKAKVLEAAAASPREPLPLQLAKIQGLWARSSPSGQPVCSTGAGQVGVLKLALDREAFLFLRTAIVEWRVSPNVMEGEDEHTLLDHVQAAIETHGNDTARQEQLIAWRRLLVENGAKTATELRREQEARR